MTPWKQDSFQRSAKRRRTSQISPSPEIQLGTLGDSTEAVCTSRHGEQIQLRATAAKTAEHRARADGYSLRGRLTPLPQESVEEVRADTPR